MKKKKPLSRRIICLAASGILTMGLVLLTRSHAGVLFGDADQTYIFWAFLCIVIGYAAISGIRLFFPQLAIKDGQLCFFASNARFLKRVRIPLDSIDAVAVRLRKPGGLVKVHGLTTFIVRLKDGSEHEYFPGLPDGKRLNAVRKILESASRGVEPAEDGTAGLESGKGASFMVALILAGCLLLMFLLAYYTTRFL